MDAIALITKMDVHTTDARPYLEWLARLMMQGIESSGATSAEIFAPTSPETSGWVLVQHFYTQEQCETWLKSNEHRKLIKELAPDLNSKKVTLSESANAAYANTGNFSVAVVTRVKEGQEQAYLNYEKQYQSAQALKPGYRGAFVQPPSHGVTGVWTTLIRFDSPITMDQWLASEERKRLITESESLVDSTDYHTVTTSYPGWFSTQAAASQGPQNWKTALLILLGLYPSVMLVIEYFLPLMQGHHPALNNFLGNILTVSFTTWLSMPLFIKIFNPWLFPDKDTPKWIAPVSVIAILICFAIEIVFFWLFF
jgi:hypothetical protein